MTAISKSSNKFVHVSTNRPSSSLIVDTSTGVFFSFVVYFRSTILGGRLPDKLYKLSPAWVYRYFRGEREEGEGLNVVRFLFRISVEAKFNGALPLRCVRVRDRDHGHPKDDGDPRRIRITK